MNAGGLSVPEGTILPGEMFAGGLVTDTGDKWLAIIGVDRRLRFVGSDLDWKEAGPTTILNPLERVWMATVRLSLRL